MIPLPSELLAQLKAGRHFEGGPITYEWAKATAATPGGTHVMHILTIEHGGGINAFVFDRDSLKAFADAATHQATGLFIATTEG